MRGIFMMPNACDVLHEDVANTPKRSLAAYKKGAIEWAW